MGFLDNLSGFVGSVSDVVGQVGSISDDLRKITGSDTDDPVFAFPAPTFTPSFQATSSAPLDA